MRLEPLLCIALIAGASPGGAQEVRDLGTTTRGRLGSDATATAAAQEAIDRAGVSCRVTNGRLRGRDASGTTHYEVACSDGPGFIVVGGPPYEATSCLLLEGARRRSGGTCRLSGNADTRRHYARMAASAGVDCVVDRGRFVGMSPQDGFIFEVSCAGPRGFWLEDSADGWLVADCLTVSSQGGECRLTSGGEDRAAFRARLAGTELAACDVSDVRAMGQGSDGTWFEVRCGSQDSVVARFDALEVLVEVIPCAEADLVGGGCRQRPTP